LNGNAISGATNSTINATTAGKYTVQVSVDDCRSEFSTEQIMVVTGDIQSTTDLLIDAYPNPAIEWIEMVFGENNLPVNLSILDLAGRELATQSTKENKVRIALESFAQGLYFIRVQTGNSVKTIRFEKK
jgi:hypothetical protein